MSVTGKVKTGGASQTITRFSDQPCLKNKIESNEETRKIDLCPIQHAHK